MAIDSVFKADQLADLISKISADTANKKIDNRNEHNQVLLDLLNNDSLASFLNINDTPSDYTGFGGWILGVAASEDGIDFIDPSTFLTTVAVDGVTITGDGTAGSPLMAMGGGGGATFYTSDFTFGGNRTVTGDESDWLFTNTNFRAVTGDGAFMEVTGDEVNLGGGGAISIFGSLNLSSAGVDQQGITFNDNGATSFSGILRNADLTAAQTWDLPDATGIIALTSDIKPSLYTDSTSLTGNRVLDGFGDSYSLQFIELDSFRVQVGSGPTLNMDNAGDVTFNFIQGLQVSTFSFIRLETDDFFLARGSQGMELTTESAGIVLDTTVSGTGANVTFTLGASGALVLPTDADPDTNISGPVNAMIKYDSTDHEIRAYINGSWQYLMTDANANLATVLAIGNETGGTAIEGNGNGVVLQDTAEGSTFTVIDEIVGVSAVSTTFTTGSTFGVYTAGSIELDTTAGTGATAAGANIVLDAGNSGIIQLNGTSIGTLTSGTNTITAGTGQNPIGFGSFGTLSLLSTAGTYDAYGGTFMSGTDPRVDYQIYNSTTFAEKGGYFIGIDGVTGLPYTSTYYTPDGVSFIGFEAQSGGERLYSHIGGPSFTAMAGTEGVLYVDSQGFIKAATLADLSANLPGGGASDLATVLAAGNTSGGTNIVMGSDSIEFGTAPGADPVIHAVGTELIIDGNGSLYNISTIAGTGSSQIRFEGNGGPNVGVIRLSNNGGSNYTTLDVSNTANRNITFQDGDGTVAFLSDVSASSLAATLVTGNTTGGTDISVGDGDDIVLFMNPAGTGTSARIYWDDDRNILIDDNNNGYIEINAIGQGLQMNWAANDYFVFESGVITNEDGTFTQNLYFPAKTANISWTLPNATGTVALTSDLAGLGNGIYGGSDALGGATTVTLSAVNSLSFLGGRVNMRGADALHGTLALNIENSTPDPILELTNGGSLRINNPSAHVAGGHSFRSGNLSSNSTDGSLFRWESSDGVNVLDAASDGSLRLFGEFSIADGTLDGCLSVSNAGATTAITGVSLNGVGGYFESTNESALQALTDGSGTANTAIYANDNVVIGGAAPAGGASGTSKLQVTGETTGTEWCIEAKDGAGITGFSIDNNGVGVARNYTVATVPASRAGGIVYVTDEVGGACLAYGDGATWRRIDTNAVIA